jgi:hypothetical protein
MRSSCHARALRWGVLAAAAVCALAIHGRASAQGLQRTDTVAAAIADETGAPILQADVTNTTGGGAQVPEPEASQDGGFAVSIDVRPSVVEIAEQQLKEQEQQRVLGVIPNFYVSFVPDAAPLNASQKLRLSWKARTDPVQFGFVALVAGVQQWTNTYSGFGDGASGYAKRYAAAYASVWTRTMITQVLLPSVLRQDPRYFYKGTGSSGSRILYAMSRSFIRKGDSKRWQPNYSGILGSLASGAVSNLYYPEEDRRGARLTLQHTAIGLAGSMVGHITQEFLFARFTKRGHRGSGK